MCYWVDDWVAFGWQIAEILWELHWCSMAVWRWHSYVADEQSTVMSEQCASRHHLQLLQMSHLVPTSLPDNRRDAPKILRVVKAVSGLFSCCLSIATTPFLMQLFHFATLVYFQICERCWRSSWLCWLWCAQLSVLSRAAPHQDISRDM